MSIRLAPEALHRLGGADEAAIQARPRDQELVVVEDLEREEVTAGRARARICCGRLHVTSIKIFDVAKDPYPCRAAGVTLRAAPATPGPRRLKGNEHRS